VLEAELDTLTGLLEVPVVAVAVVQSLQVGSTQLDETEVEVTLAGLEEVVLVLTLADQSLQVGSAEVEVVADQSLQVPSV